MAHYLVLYHDGDVSAEDTPELSTWISRIGNSLVDSGSSLTDGQRIKAGKAEVIKDLPCTSYVILDTSTQDEASELASGFPGLEDDDSLDIYKLAD